MRLLALIVVMLVPSFSLASNSFLPPNDLYLQDRTDRESASMTDAQFNEITDSIINIYKPFAESQGSKLSVNKLWDDSTVNAYASKPTATDWTITMFGGLARRPEVTPDGYAMVVCHELGHHFSGFAFYDGSDMSSEGAADWFATGACAKRIWSNKSENKEAAMPAPAGYKKWCADKGGDVCVRSLLAGQSLANLLAKLNNNKVPSYQTPDQNIVKNIFEGHPKAQARLDTYLAGIVCRKGFPTAYRPGLASNGVGYNTKAAEASAREASCANFPLSWYASPLK